ncbi:ribonuclease P protein component [Pseudonocardia sp. MH-G8]|uniref:ribonuclease P protein component n=1 Tax=Pseudonocardia sp. MH-G8 TaxID=1854588 RepID=UPI000B9FC55A|nr:ribonuclease P protein component [Pseudonocardia sp. MH-G8]OZM82425.1 ribonuclease P protein component [Pseudonocardia sp. MH-G8]
MLPAGSRLTHRDEFASVLRRGRRSGRSRLVVHLKCDVGPIDGAPTNEMSRPRAGLVVSKAVGGSVVRHRVSRRLRHLLAPRLGTLPAGSLLVIRALPPSASASSAELAEDLDSGLKTALRKVSGARRG